MTAVVVADCIGPGDPERFARDNIIVELDARLWARLTAEHGRPLAVRLEY